MVATTFTFSLSRDNSIFSHDNGIIYLVSHHHKVESECLIFDHADLVLSKIPAAVREDS